jgi:hypothetical protein
MAGHTLAAMRAAVELGTLSTPSCVYDHLAVPKPGQGFAFGSFRLRLAPVSRPSLFEMSLLSFVAPDCRLLSVESLLLRLPIVLPSILISDCSRIFVFPVLCLPIVRRSTRVRRGIEDLQSPDSMVLTEYI